MKNYIPILRSSQINTKILTELLQNDRGRESEMKFVDTLMRQFAISGKRSHQTVEKVAETTRIYKSEHFSLFSTIPK